jgi:PAS domain-containing protein
MEQSIDVPVLYVREPRSNQFTYVDPACVDQTGFTQAELLYGDIRFDTFSDRSLLQLQSVNQVLLMGAAEVVEFMCMIRRKDEGTWRPVSVRVELLVVPDHRPQILSRVSELNLATMSAVGPACESGERELDSAHV